jgi:hypothetical protein
MALRFENLPTDLQQQILQSGRSLGAVHDGVSAPVPIARTIDPPHAGQWRCGSCSYLAPSWAAAERHADKEHHHRIECIVEQIPGRR